MYINEDMRKEEKDKRDVVGIFQRRGERKENTTATFQGMGNEECWKVDCVQERGEG